jgi:23S rRNA (guanosine2251-2'-O)-methyltransferase
MVARPLNQRQGRPQPFIVSGPNAVMAALLSPRVRPLELVVRDSGGTPRRDEIVREAKARKVSVRTLPAPLFDRQVDEGIPHQGITLTLADYSYVPFEEMLDAAVPPGLVLVLDHVQDAGNLGAIIRSAHATGASGVVIPNARAAGVTPAVVRASAGAALMTPVCQVANLANMIRVLKERGYWIHGLEADGRAGFDGIDPAGPVALVVGGEHQGLSRLVREACDTIVSIPMAAPGSFNASVAAAIALYDVMRRRRSK